MNFLRQDSKGVKFCPVSRQKRIKSCATRKIEQIPKIKIMERKKNLVTTNVTKNWPVNSRNGEM